MEPGPGPSWLDDAPMPPPEPPPPVGLIPSFLNPLAPLPPPEEIFQQPYFPPPHAQPAVPWAQQHLGYNGYGNAGGYMPPNPAAIFPTSSSNVREVLPEEGASVQHVLHSERYFEPEPANYVYDRNWVEASFYEEDNLEPHGTFETSQERFYIDGLASTDSRGTRFSLGKYVMASPLIQTVKLIGNGVEIWRDQVGNAFLRNVSKTAVFVQAPNYASRTIGPDPSDTVYRVASPYREPDSHMTSIILFDVSVFRSHLKKIRKAMDAVKLVEHCYIRISMLKGFQSTADKNPRYNKYPDIFSTPIWVELKLNMPLLWVDEKFSKFWYRPPRAPPKRRQKTNKSSNRVQQ